MRPLTEEESKVVFTKLANYIVSLALARLSPPSLSLAPTLPGQEPGSFD